MTTLAWLTLRVAEESFHIPPDLKSNQRSTETRHQRFLHDTIEMDEKFYKVPCISPVPKSTFTWRCLLQHSTTFNGIKLFLCSSLIFSLAAASQRHYFQITVHTLFAPLLVANQKYAVSTLPEASSTWRVHICYTLSTQQLAWNQCDTISGIPFSLSHHSG